MANKSVGALWITGKSGDFWTGCIELDKLVATAKELGVDPNRIPIKVMNNGFKKEGSRDPDLKIHVNDWKPKPKEA